MTQSDAMQIAATQNSGIQLSKKLYSYSIYLFIIVTAVATFIPLHPRMPSAGLDGSWEYAMNAAVAQHKSFGREIAFTYGPYASVVTRTYDPATDRRMLYSSLAVALAYGTALLFLGRGKGRFYVPLLLLFLATFGDPELTLVSYAFMLPLCVLRTTDGRASVRWPGSGWRESVVGIFLWSTLGFLPLVKGSLLLPFVASLATSSAFLLYKSRIWQGLASFLIPIGSGLALWGVAGQSFKDLPAFFSNTVQLTAGYTEAMATTWLILPRLIGDGFVLIFLVLAALILWSIYKTSKLPVTSRWMLSILSVVFLFVLFKHGFVKADVVPSAFSSIAVVALILGLICMDRYMVVALSIAVALSAGTSVMRDSTLIEAVHAKFGAGITWAGKSRPDVFAFCLQRALEAYPRTTYKATWKTYADAMAGLRVRTSAGNELGAQFQNAVEAIRQSRPFPALKGGVDLYEMDQAALLASGNEWNPRPVIQSYSAYTPALLRMNEQHLRGPDAPAWIAFELQTIDGRLPSLDDGASWPAILDNYKFESYDGRYALLQRRPAIVPSSRFSIVKRTCKAGETVTLSPSAESDLIFAEVELKPTLAGRLLTTLFDPPQLSIVIGTSDGKSHKYRVVSNMMKQGFLLSPLVSTTEEFALVTGGEQGQLNKGRVETIAIAPSYGGSVFWSDTYSLTMKRYTRPDD